MESGEDPEKIEEEMGDVFEEDPFGGLLGGEGGRRTPPTGRRTSVACAGCSRPTHDPELYEM